jgi:hypothetical protein
MKSWLKPIILLNLVLFTLYLDVKNKIKDRQPHIELNQYITNIIKMPTSSISFFITRLQHIRGKARIVHPTEQNIKGMARIVSPKESRE